MSGVSLHLPGEAIGLCGICPFWGEPSALSPCPALPLGGWPGSRTRAPVSRSEEWMRRSRRWCCSSEPHPCAGEGARPAGTGTSLWETQSHQLPRGGTCPREMKTLCPQGTSGVRVHSSTIPEMGEHPKRPPVDKKERSPDTTAWMDLKHVTLSDRRQIHWTRGVQHHSCEVARAVHPQGRKRTAGTCPFGVSKCSELDRGEGCTTLLGCTLQHGQRGDVSDT